jgi:hypothetical protein
MKMQVLIMLSCVLKLEKADFIQDVTICLCYLN